MKNKDKPTYNIWQGVCFMLKAAWNTHKSVLVMCVAIAAVKVGLSVTQLYVSPQILQKVEQGATVGELLTTIGIFTAALFLFTGLRDYLIQNRLPGEVDVRTSIIRRITRKSCETSYPNIRDPKVLELKEQAGMATSSNRAPTEYIWTTLTQILTNVTGFGFYLFLLSDLNVFLLLVILLTSVIGFFVTKHINEWENRNREEKERCEKGYFS